MPARIGQREEWEDDDPREDGGHDDDPDADPDADPDTDDDAHDAADRARFSSDTGFCPECGAEIHDAADICPKCFSWIDGATHRTRARFSPGLRKLVVAALLTAFFSGALLWILAALLR